MLVATKPYGNSDFEYPEILLEPFSAPSVSIIPQSEAIKKWEEEEALAKKEAEKESEVQIPVVNPSTIKPDSIKPSEILQQTLAPIKKKEVQKVIEVQEERAESAEDKFAPIPLDSNNLD